MPDIDARLTEAFDRGEALAGPGGVIMQLLAEAWDDGYDAGDRDARAVQATYPDPTPNPYLTRDNPPGQETPDA